MCHLTGARFHLMPAVFFGIPSQSAATCKAALANSCCSFIVVDSIGPVKKDSLACKAKLSAV
jgi:hypothetical protein